jgi:predicted ATPase
MKILKIRIDGFKNIDNTTIDFTGLNALIALNNYGKSNIFEAIDFANDFIQFPEKIKSNQMQFQNSVPINITKAETNFEFEIEYETQYNNTKTIVNYLFSFEWIKQNNKGKRIVKEKLKIKEISDLKPSTYIDRSVTNKFYKPSNTGRCDKKIEVGNNMLIINKLKNFDDLFFLQIVEEINNFDFDFISLYNIDGYFVPSSNVVVNDGGKTVDNYESPNISKFFYEFSNDEKNKYELLINSIIDLLPEIEYIKPIQIDFRSKTNNLKNIPFEIPEKIYDIRIKIKTNNQETSIKSLSEGSKRIFHIIASAVIANHTGTQILAFEELENSIHPALLQRLLTIISEISEKTQILITSHSPHLIKYLDLNDIYIGIPNKEGLAYFKQIKKTKHNKLIKYAKDSDTSLGDFIFDMLIEGFDNDSFWNEFI